MVVTELDSFVQKFYQLWSAGISAHLDLETHAGRAWVGLRAPLGHAPGHLYHHRRPFPQPAQKQESPSRQRRRARRAAARTSKAEEAHIAQDVAEEAADAVEAKSNEVSNAVEETEIYENDNDNSESSVHVDLNDQTLTDTAEKDSVNDMIIADELCPDKDFENATPSAKTRSICTVELFPVKYKLDRLEEFRERIENYFANRKDVIERVIKCEVVNYGNNVKLVTEMKVERGWIFFYGDPEENYPDLEGIRSVRHSCQDLSNCDRG